MNCNPGGNGYLCTSIPESNVQFRNIQRAIQSQPAAGAARGADTAGADPHAGRRQPDGRPLRRQRPHAAGRRVVRRRRLLHPLHRRHRHRTGHDASRGRTLRAGRPREIVGTAPERHSLLRTAGRGDGRRAVRRHSADVPPRPARRSGRHGHPLLQDAGVEHAVHHAVLHLQAVPRRRGQHEGRDVRHDRGQPREHRLQLGVHLRPLRISRDGRRGRGPGRGRRCRGRRG